MISNFLFENQEFLRQIGSRVAQARNNKEQGNENDEDKSLNQGYDDSRERSV